MSSTTQLFRQAPAKSKYLLVVNKGPGDVDIPRQEGLVDLLEIYFMPSDIERVKADQSSTTAEYIVFETDKLRRKFAIVKSIFESYDFWLKYDAIMLADDDVEPVDCTVFDIFTLFMETGCRIGQPALTHDSFFAHFLTVKNTNFIWRRVNHIDFMCIMMTRDAIKDYIHILDENISSFGFDLYWGLNEWRRGTAHAVLDRTPMRHSRPVGGGESQKGIPNPGIECQTFMRKHGLVFYPKICLGGVFARDASNRELLLSMSLSGYGRDFLKDKRYAEYTLTELAAYVGGPMQSSASTEIIDSRFFSKFAWRFSREDGSTISSEVILNPDGTITGGHEYNENRWKLIGGFLVFEDSDGGISTFFSERKIENPGFPFERIVFAGPYRDTNTIHILTQLKHALASSSGAA